MFMDHQSDHSSSFWRDLIVLFFIILFCFMAYKSQKALDSLDPENQRIEQHATKVISTFQMDLIKVEEFQQLIVQVVDQQSSIFPQAGDLVKIKYKGMFSDGSRFDSSYEEESEIEFYAGFPGVIQGLSEGILKVPLDSFALIKIPYFLAYGAKSQGGLIPAKSNLHFEVLLLKIDKAKTYPKLVKKDLNQAIHLDGLMIWELEKGKGQNINPEAYFYYDYNAYLEDGRLINSTFVKNEQETFTTQSSLYYLLRAAFTNRKMGDKLLIKTNPIKSNQKILNYNSNQSFYFEITL
ncbi:FKBP-type peptidyl-prolyl cis-trans isomerase [bacterium]|nr:FKBP-type peptidyl-prolyl cis-trans isomerase [bacterium]